MIWDKSILCLVVKCEAQIHKSSLCHLERGLEVKHTTHWVKHKKKTKSTLCVQVISNLCFEVKHKIDLL